MQNETFACTTLFCCFSHACSDFSIQDPFFARFSSSKNHNTLCSTKNLLSTPSISFRPIPTKSLHNFNNIIKLINNYYLNIKKIICLQYKFLACSLMPAKTLKNTNLKVSLISFFFSYCMKIAVIPSSNLKSSSHSFF